MRIIQTKKNRTIPIAKNIYLVFLGLFGFSMLGQHIVLNVLHLPFSFMEIYFLPAIWVKRANIFNALKHMKYVTLKRALLYIILACGIVFGVFSTFELSVLIEYRSIFYMLLCFTYVQRSELECTANDILKVSFFTVISETIYVVFVTTDTITSSTNCVAIALAIITSFVLEKYFLALFCIILSFVLTISTGFRLGIIVVVLCVAEMIVFMLIRKDCKYKLITIAKRMGVFTVIIVLAFIGLNYYIPIVNLVADLTGMSTFAVFRTTERMLGFFRFDFVASQDLGRLEVFEYSIQRILQIMPRGLVGEIVDEYWLYIDVPIIYLYDLFGSLTAFCCIFWFLRVSVSNLIRYKTNSQSQLKLICFWIIPVIILLFVINGSYMVIVYQAILTGFILGILSNRNLIKAA